MGTNQSKKGDSVEQSKYHLYEIYGVTVIIQFGRRHFFLNQTKISIGSSTEATRISIIGF